MNGKLMSLVQKEIQRNPQLLSLMQQPLVLQKLTVLAENLSNITDENVVAQYADDSDVLSFIKVLQPVIKQFQQSQEEEFAKQAQNDDKEYKNDEQYKRMELLISGYIRSQTITSQSHAFMVNICVEMCYVSFLKLKKLCGDAFIKKVQNDKNEIEYQAASFEADIIGNDFILFYFSGCWCPPSKQFTPKLSAFYDKCIANGHKLQIIFITSDNSESAFKRYYKDYHGDYLAIPWQEEERRESLSSHFNNRYIPAVYALNDQAQIIDNDARWTVTNDGNKNYDAIEMWTKRNAKLKKTI